MKKTINDIKILDLFCGAYSPLYLSNRPSRTVVTWPPRVYMGYDRKCEPLSVDDVKTLMGFPRNYKLYGSIAAQYKQLGNAVCPPVSKAIAESLKNKVC